MARVFADSVHVFRIAAVALAAATAIGCASQGPDVASRDSADALPPEARKVTLTLWPFHEIPWLSPGFGVPLPLGGVLVCVSRRRPHGGSWEDFVETDEPCATTEEGAPLVLKDAPGLSELIITAKKDGYQSGAFAVTTGAWDQDVRTGFTARDNFSFSLMRIGGLPGLVDVPMDPLAGSLWFSANLFAAGAPGQPTQFGFLGGVSVALVPDAPTPPFYFLGGRPIAGATSTVPGSVSVDDLDQVAGALFVNLPVREYEVHAAHPHAVCGSAASGNLASLPHFGFTGPGGSLRAPVLAGHVSFPIVAECSCLESRDVRYCEPSGDAGLDAAAP